MPRHPRRVNYQYLARIFACLDDLGIDPTELPHAFIDMAWEDKLNFLRDRYQIDVCYRCKLPQRPEEMDMRGFTCQACANSARMTQLPDRRIIQLLNAAPSKRASLPTVSIPELPSEPPTPVRSSTADVMAALDRRKKAQSGSNE